MASKKQLASTAATCQCDIMTLALLQHIGLLLYFIFTSLEYLVFLNCSSIFHGQKVAVG